MTLQINGHSDTTEINPTELSYRRAEAVLTQLIEAGIDRKRLSSIGFGATRPVVSERIIKKAKANEKPTLRQLNCIVSFECTHFEIE